MEQLRDPLTEPLWFALRGCRDDCNCGAEPDACHLQTCAITPIYAQTFTDTGQPSFPWQWPWLLTDLPECTCDDEPQFCLIHGEPPWMRPYVARWQK